MNPIAPKSCFAVFGKSDPLIRKKSKFGFCAILTIHGHTDSCVLASLMKIGKWE